ncbi:MAG: rhomboid family intramembrane serine protease [Verrucomicrobia bacterium]|nr:MAG: rhomboid family intramembrane serine protease [Verrucomicrobiota bacterium]
MLEDRDYMRTREGRSWLGPSMSAWLVILVANVVVFFVETTGGARFGEAFLKYGALSLDGLKHGFVWQLLTYQFMHGGLGHLLVNSFVLYSFGRALESMLGTRNFLSLYLLSGFVGGFFQIILGLFFDRFAGAMVGASAGICGLVGAYALLNPESTIYLFLILPLRAVLFLPLLIAATVLFILVPSNDHVAHGAHLGGILAGVAWVKLGWHRGFVQWPWDGLLASWRQWKPIQSRQRKRELVRAASVRGRAWRDATMSADAELPPEEFISKQVDPILDKISAHGIHSLTESERKILEAARKKMTKRK